MSIKSLKPVTNVTQILSSILDIPKLIKSHPELFNLDILGVHEKYILLKEDFDLFKDKINLNIIHGDDKVYILSQKDAKIKKIIQVTSVDIENMSRNSYFSLLNLNFTKYIDIKKYKTLTNEQQQNIAARHPDWVVNNMKALPRFSAASLRDISTNTPSYIEKYITDFKNITTDQYFWANMIKYNKKYREVFLNNMHTVTTKTDVRGVIYRFPDLINDIKSEHIQNSKLTAKEWALLIGAIKKYSKSKSIKPSTEFIDELKLDLTTEMLQGTSKTSAQFKNAMSRLANVEN